ncbi:hypothetical protein DFH28DRAFT_937483 [Melampsora americana]|nr:hypothetical protein DFH28DRAFT_937483 [Melampsora americana]
MDSINIIEDPGSSFPTQQIPTSTPTLILNSVQNPSISIDTNAPDSQPSSTSSSFVVPMLSSADWAQTQQSVPSNHSNPISQPCVMATPNPPKKRGRPRKPPALASQKPPKKIKGLQMSQPPGSDTQIESSTHESQAKTHTENDEEDKTKFKKCCNFENFNAWRTQQKNIVRDRVAAYLVSKGHADRGGRECEKKVAALIQWFHHANALRKGTGEGNMEVEVEFDVSKEQLAELKWNKRRVLRKVEKEEGSLQVRILRRCPWYEELEPVFRDQPLANPLATRDSQGQEERQSMSSLKPSKSQSPTGSSVTYTWEETPPPHQPEDKLPGSQEPPPSLPQASQSNKSSQPVTPSNAPSKRHQFNTRDVSNNLEESETQAIKSQEQISSNLSKDMCKMMTTNRAMEMATKENIAISKMNVEIRIARSKMVVNLIRGNMDPTQAEALALRALPDVQPSRTSTQLPDAEASGNTSGSQVTQHD